jgi:hypothetical protein
MLYYNYALTLYRNEETDEAVHNLKSAIRLDNLYPSSHLLLANIMYEKNKRSPALMSCMFFLLLENNTQRSITGIKLLTNIMNAGVELKGKNSVNIYLDENALNDTLYPYNTVDLTIPLLMAMRNEKKNKKVSTEAFLSKTLEDTFSMIAELNENNNFAGEFWHDMYGKFFGGLQENKHTEALFY